MIAAGLLLAALLLTDAPMTDDEVVRRVVAGESVEAILDDVKRRPPDFDVSEEMLAELRTAGVPEELITAMVARAAAAPQKPAPEPAGGAAVPMAELRIRPENPELTLSRNLDPQKVAELELPAGALAADGLALAIVCTTRSHDDPGVLRWPEGKLPKDLSGSRLIGFFPAVEAGRSGGKLRVTLPSPVVVPIQAEVSHDLVVAVVLHAGGHWVVIGGDELNGARAAAGAFTSADLKVQKASGLARVTVRRPVDVALPELPRSEGWAKGGHFAGRAARAGGQAMSPDGRKRVLVGKDGASLEIEGLPAGSLAFPAPGDAEVLWSPDSKVLAITGGSATGSSVAAWRIEPDDAVRALPLPDDVKGLTALSALGFAADGGRLLLVSRDGGRLTGYLLKTSDGTLAARFTELEIRARWGDRLGPRLR